MDPSLQSTRDSQIYNEGLIFERSMAGRVAFSLPDDDRDLSTSIDSSLIRPADDLHLPEVGELDVIRHFTRLSTWNYNIDMNLYPLGSCTMKYNPRINEEIAALPGFTSIHPDLPEKYNQPLLEVLYKTQDLLCKLTDMDGATLQPAAGAHGELAGLYMIYAAMEKRGEKRDTILIPDSAHGTNPASCTLAGFKVKQVKSREDGLLDVEDIRASLDSSIAGLMITNPSTLGIFEQNIRVIADMLHENGSLLYMDGANYNAIIGNTSLKEMGVDISHLNLHKTFSTPHGGGGPGAAAVVVSGEMVDFLPDPVVDRRDDGSFCWKRPEHTIGRMKAGPGHSGIALRALSYMLTWGNQIHEVAEHSVLNANLVRHLLKDDYQIASDQDTMHEAVFSDASFKKSGFTTLDVAKSLIDYGYHPPTVFFPLNVSGAMMIEPTETESPERIRHFTQVMKDIKKRMDAGDQTLKDSPVRAFATRVDEVRAARNPVLNHFKRESGK